MKNQKVFLTLKEPLLKDSSKKSFYIFYQKYVFSLKKGIMSKKRLKKLKRVKDILDYIENVKKTARIEKIPKNAGFA